MNQHRKTKTISELKIDEEFEFTTIPHTYKFKMYDPDCNIMVVQPRRSDFLFSVRIEADHIVLIKE